MSQFAPLQHKRARKPSLPISSTLHLQPDTDLASSASTPDSEQISSAIDWKAEVAPVERPGYSLDLIALHHPEAVADGEAMQQSRSLTSQHVPAEHGLLQLQQNAQTGSEVEADQQPQENHTGLPDSLKAGVESLSGYSLNDIQVHYNSPRPAQVNALAYTQGTEIHVGPGQEQHVAHEAWHVVQQKQGRVQPTIQMADIAINDDDGLEKEADVMGKQANQPLPQGLQRQGIPDSAVSSSVGARPVHSLMADTIQRKLQWYIPQPDPNPNADAVASIVSQIDGVVQEARDFVLGNPIASIFQTLDGYTKRWLGVFEAFVYKDEKEWLSTSIGYVIESYTNFKLPAQIGNHTILLQQTRGGTRPDFVIQDTATGQEVAWLDITSSGSVGHINRKSGRGWQNMPYVAEILYEKVSDEEFLKAAKAIKGNQALDAEQFKSLQIGKVQKVVWKRMLEQASDALRLEFDTNYQAPGKDKQKNQAAVREKFAKFFGFDMSPKLAAGLLRVIGLSPKTRKYGLDAVVSPDLEQAREVLAFYADEHYEEKPLWDQAAIELSTTLNAPTSGPTDALFGAELGDISSIGSLGLGALLENQPEQFQELVPTLFFDYAQSEQGNIEDESFEADETPEAKRRRLKEEVD